MELFKHALKHTFVSMLLSFSVQNITDRLNLTKEVLSVKENKILKKQVSSSNLRTSRQDQSGESLNT